jgi:hypothetical protein
MTKATLLEQVSVYCCVRRSENKMYLFTTATMETKRTAMMKTLAVEVGGSEEGDNDNGNGDSPRTGGSILLGCYCYGGGNEAEELARH